MNFQVSTTILNACTKTVWKLIEGITYYLVYSKIRPVYLIREISEVFIPLMRFLPHSLVLNSLLVRLVFSSVNFFLSSTLVCRCPHPLFPSACNFSFHQSVLIVSWFCSSIPFIISLFPRFFLSMTHFSKHSYIFAFYSYCLYQSLQIFFLFLNRLISSIYLR